MILVAGGTGRLGTLVVERLARTGAEVRVLTRDPARARHLGNLPAEVIVGDVRDRASIDAAMNGVTTVVAAVHGFAGPGRVSPASVDRDGVAGLIDSAADVDVGLRGLALDVGGAQNLTFNELGALLQDVRGRPAKIHHIPRSMLRVMAPFNRQPRAALVMDAADMTFDALAARDAFADLPVTDIRVALERAHQHQHH